VEGERVEGARAAEEGLGTGAQLGAQRPALLVSVVVIATCGLVYELVAGTLASYLLGDSVTQFSTVIGVYLFAMGVGSWLSRFVEKGVAQRFVEVELAVAVAGGSLAPLLFATFALTDAFRLVLYALVALIGVLVGLEIPLLLRLLKDSVRFKDLVSQVLSVDYLGALAASLLFPLLLVPRLGLVRTSLLFGLLNAAVGLWSTWLLAPVLPNANALRLRAVAVVAALLVALGYSDRITAWGEQDVYPDDVVFARSTPYQRVVMTRGARGFSLFLNGNLQFSSADEYRYHEALVHPAFLRAGGVKRVLVLGGGDGLAVREVLRHPGVEEVVLVDLDADVTGLARGYQELSALNARALEDGRVRVLNQDALLFLAEGADLFDVVVVDFPDPNNFSLGKLYTTRFYGLLKRRLAPDGVAVVQSTSPLVARRSFWCVDATLRAAGFWTEPYHALVPSFGEWGYVLAAHGERPRVRPLPPGLRFLSEEVLPTLTVFPADMGPLPAEVNRLNNQVLVQYYEEEWRRWN
jgi:spermidine synthase